MERGKGDEKGGHGENVPHTATQNTKVLPGTSARNVRYKTNRVEELRLRAIRDLKDAGLVMPGMRKLEK